MKVLFLLLICPSEGSVKLCVLCGEQFSQLLPDVAQFDQFVDNGVDGEAGRGVDLQLAGNVAAVGDDGVDAEEELFGNGFVGHSLYDAGDDLFLALAQGV